MSVLYLLIPIGLVILVLSIKMLFWAINNGQYDDLDMEAHRILFDDDPALPTKKSAVAEQVSDNRPSASTHNSASPKPIDTPKVIDEDETTTHHK
jgi:cbb3-type cytochrome oxidase maturation protein